MNYTYKHMQNYLLCVYLRGLLRLTVTAYESTMYIACVHDRRIRFSSWPGSKYRQEICHMLT